MVRDFSGRIRVLLSVLGVLLIGSASAWAEEGLVGGEEAASTQDIEIASEGEGGECLLGDWWGGTEEAGGGGRLLWAVDGHGLSDECARRA